MRNVSLASPVLVASLILLPVGGLSGQQPLPPDTTLELEPIHIRVLRSELGSGTPASVSTVSGAELTRGRAGAYLEEALTAVPGLHIQNRFNLASGERLMIRGFGSRAQFGIRGVRVLVDGIPATLADGQTAIDHVDLGGLGRAEILRGPSSSLYGNAAGGVLDLRSLRPTSAPAGEVRGVGGSHGLRSLYAGFGDALGGSGRYRVSVQRFSSDGFRRDPVAADGSLYGGAERTVANALLLFPLGDGELRFIVNGLDMDARNPGSLNAAAFAEGGREAHRGSVLQRTREVVRQGQVGATWSGRLGAFDGEVSLWGLHRRLDGPIPPRVLELRRDAGGLRGAARRSVAVGDGVLTLGGGIELEAMSDARRNWENDGGDPGSLLLDQQERVRGVGAFLQARWDVSTGLALHSGLRYDGTRFAADDALVSPTNPDDSGIRTMDALSPTAGIVATVAAGTEAFGSVSRSFQTPTTTELANRPDGPGGFNPELDPQTGTTVEAGLRSRLSDFLSVEWTLFRTTLTGELVPYEVPSGGGRTFFRNAGASRHRGVEAAATVRPGGGVSVRLAYTRVDARFTDYTVDGADYSDNRIPGLSPDRFDGTVTLDRGRAFMALRALYEGPMPLDDANTERSGGHFLADVRAGLRALSLGSAGLEPFVSVTNVFDTLYASSVVTNAFGGRFFEPGPPRSFQVGMSVRWERRTSPRSP